MYKNIFYRLMAAYFTIAFIIVYFIPMVLFCSVFYYLNDHKRIFYFQKFSKLFIGLLLKLCGIKLYIKNNGVKISPHQAHIVVCNHRSLLDIVVLTPFFPTPIYTIGKDSFAKIPLFSIIYKTGSILVNRKNALSRLKSYQALKAMLQKNIGVCIYPEGTRNKKNDNTLLPFQAGAFKLAKETNIPIITTMFLSNQHIMPATKMFYINPQPVHLHILNIYYPQHFNTFQEMQAHIYKDMEEYSKKHLI